MALGWLACLVLMASSAPARAQFDPNSIFYNLVEKPTNNRNVFGTLFNGDGFVTQWGGNYMMYQLKMSIPALQTEPYYFASMYVQVFANKGNQNNDPTNALRFALFNEDPIPNDLSDAFALARTVVNQASVSPTFTQYLLGPSTSSGAGIPVNTQPSNYWLMIYAGGNVANQGYGLKIDSVLREVEFYDNAGEVVDVQYLGGNPPTYQTSAAFVPVPEPSPLAGVCSLAALVLAYSRRRFGRH